LRLESPHATRFFAGDTAFLVGHNGSKYAGHATGVRLETGPSCDRRKREAAIGHLADRVLPVIGEPPEIGSTVVLNGYQQDHPLVLMADTECHVVWRVTDATGRVLLRHNCTGTRDDSGAPLLIEKERQMVRRGN
jgi:protease YdgD